MDVYNRITDMDGIAAKAIEEKKFLEDNLEVICGCPFPITFSGQDTRIIIDNLADLIEARAFMHKLFGTRKFEYQHSFFSGCAISTFKNKDIGWSIWLECSIEDFPKELFPSTECEWLQVENKEYNLVCNL